MGPARWAGYGYNGQTDAGFLLMCPVANGGRLPEAIYKAIDDLDKEL